MTIDTHDTAETARLTADVAAFGHDNAGIPHILLIKRRWAPYEGCWALPGGHVDPGEDTEDAARRELKEETGLDVGYLLPAGAYAEPGRDPRGRYVTFAYVASFDRLPQATAADDAAETAWVPVGDALQAGFPLAFDHGQIISDALAARPR
jgi:8-oxo-dGTP diphosphatase